MTTLGTAFVYQYTYDIVNHLFFLYGLTEANENVALAVHGFPLFFYVDIPAGVQSKRFMCALKDVKTKRGRASDILGFSRVEMNCLYTHKGPRLYVKATGLSGSYLLSSMREIVRTIETEGVKIDNITYIPKVHEGRVSPELQFMCARDLKSVGWVKFRGVKQPETNATGEPNDRRATRCPHEYQVNYLDIHAEDKDDMPLPLVLSFDIEVYSEGATFPVPTVRSNAVFNISSVCSNGEKRLFTLEKPGDETWEIPGVKVVRRETERSLLVEYANYVRRLSPNVIIGYNIFRFDLPYLIGRAELLDAVENFNVQGFRVNERSYTRKLRLEGHNKRFQEFPFVEHSGIVYIDLYPIAKKDYKLDNYKLNTVSEHILGDSKHDMDVKTMQEAYRSRDAEMLRRVGEYCVQDSALVLRLFDKTNAWIGCCEMARTCNVQIFQLYTSGQQIRFFAQVYRYAQQQNMLINPGDYLPVMSRYTGAVVLSVIPGLYENIVPFDFASLYPSAIIAYNLDYTTIIPPEEATEGDNVIEWEETDGTRLKFCFRDAKVQKGVIPTLLENLLSARKRTNLLIKEKKARLNELSPEERKAEERMINVLHNRQLSYKISANSMYGATGVKPETGSLPFMPIAACTTAIGRRSLRTALEFMETVKGAKVVYGDTDSVQCLFPSVSTGGMTREEMFTMALEIEAEINQKFRSPMKLCFEGHIFQKFLILSKKMYMSIQLLPDGSTKFNSKGIVLARRDNSLYVRQEYKRIVSALFNGLSFDQFTTVVLQSYLRPYHVTLDNELDELREPAKGRTELRDAPSTRLVDYSSYVITCTVGEAEQYERNVHLPDDPSALRQRLRDARVETREDYIRQAMPLNVQLARKMMSRGVRVDVGERLEYVVIYHPASEKISHKVEQLEFFTDNAEYLSIDKLYYVKQLHNPLLNIAKAVFGEAGERALTQIYKTIKRKQKMKPQLNQCTRFWVLP